MNSIKYTLLCDGSSDKALLPILDWLFQQHLPDFEINRNWADLSRIPQQLKSLSERIKMSIDVYPCDFLFVHRDAENQGREQRIAEIEKAVNELGKSFNPKVIYVIPVRMTEAWLLFNEPAIRKAASNPSANNSLKLPSLRKVESEVNPKNLLYELLKEASGLSGRRLKKFRPQECVHRVADLIEDFTPLRSLTAFECLESDVRKICETLKNNS